MDDTSVSDIEQNRQLLKINERIHYLVYLNIYFYFLKDYAMFNFVRSRIIERLLNPDHEV